MSNPRSNSRVVVAQIESLILDILKLYSVSSSTVLSLQNAKFDRENLSWMCFAVSIVGLNLYCDLYIYICSIETYKFHSLQNAAFVAKIITG